jgi:hypothetical protein
VDFLDDCWLTEFESDSQNETWLPRLLNRRRINAFRHFLADFKAAS